MFLNFEEGFDKQMNADKALKYLAEEVEKIKEYVDNSTLETQELIDDVGDKLWNLNKYANDHGVPFYVFADDLVSIFRDDVYEEESSSYYEEESSYYDDEYEEEYDDEEEEDSDY